MRLEIDLAHLGPHGINMDQTNIGVYLLAFPLCIDSPIPRLRWFTGYLAMTVVAIMTILVQPSSALTSIMRLLAEADLIIIIILE